MNQRTTHDMLAPTTSRVWRVQVFLIAVIAVLAALAFPVSAGAATRLHVIARGLDNPRGLAFLGLRG